jgi:hypothetical protein
VEIIISIHDFVVKGKIERALDPASIAQPRKDDDLPERALFRVVLKTPAAFDKLDYASFLS